MRAPAWEQCRSCGRGARRLDAITHAPHCATRHAPPVVPNLPTMPTREQTLEAKVWAWLNSAPLYVIQAELDVLPCMRAAGCELGDAIDALMWGRR